MEQDLGTVGHLGEGDPIVHRAIRGEQIGTGGGDDDEILGEDPAQTQPRHLRGEFEGAGDEREVELAAGQRFDELTGPLLHQLELDTGVGGVEPADRLGHEAHAQGRGRTQPNPALLQARELIHVTADRLGVGEHALRRRQQRRPGIGERDVTMRAVEELGSELLLQRRDLSRQGGLGQVERRGGFREMAGGGHLGEASQLFEVHDRSPCRSDISIAYLY